MPLWRPSPALTHRVLAWCWLLLLVPSLLWWRESLPWVVGMSHYANIASEFAATHAASGLTDEDMARIKGVVAEAMEAWVIQQTYLTRCPLGHVGISVSEPGWQLVHLLCSACGRPTRICPTPPTPPTPPDGGGGTGG